MAQQYQRASGDIDAESAMRQRTRL